MIASRSTSSPVRLTVVILAATFLVLPVLGLLLRTPWTRLTEIVLSPEVAEALFLSLRCSLAATLLCVVLGLPLASWLAEGRSTLRSLMRVAVTLPMILPPVVCGVALLLAFGRNGVLGRPLHDWLGLTLPYSSWGVVLAACYVALPFFVLTTEAGFRALDRRQEEAAATLGAGPFLIFRSITLPALAPSLAAATLVAWARALGEFGATITFAGNLAGETRTMPLAVHVALERSPEAAITLSLVLVLISVLILFLMRKHWFPAR